MLTPVDGTRLPVSLTSFVGRTKELAALRRLVDEHRMVTLTGTGGVGKTRLAQQLAGETASRFDGGTWWVDLASTTDPHLVADRVAHALGLPDQLCRPTAGTLVGFLAERRALLVLDNCEQLLGGCPCCAELLAELLTGCPELRIVVTSREPIRVSGEVSWPTPPLSLDDEAVELFIQRVRLVRPTFGGTGDDAALVAEICARLDGVPLAIELAATRVRALSLAEIANGLGAGLHLLSDGVHAADSRQRTLRASMDWSHNLLSEPQQVMFRRLAVFLRGFDLAAAHAVAGSTAAAAAVPGDPVLDTLTQLVDKSLLIADSTGQSTRYRMLETVQHYALEKLDESGETATVCSAHRDHYASAFKRAGSTLSGRQVAQAEIEIDNLRTAFAWSREHGQAEVAASLASSLLPLWIHRRPREGLAWLESVHGADIAPATRAAKLADEVILAGLIGDHSRLDQADEALTIARDLNNPGLLAWALTAAGFARSFRPPAGAPYFREALNLASTFDDDWRLCQIYNVQAHSAYISGDPTTLRESAEEGLALARALGDRLTQRQCSYYLGIAHLLRGDLAAAAAQGAAITTEATAAHDLLFIARGSLITAECLTRQGETARGYATAQAGLTAIAGFPDFHRSISLVTLVHAALGTGDIATAAASAAAAHQACPLPQLWAINTNPVARTALAEGNVAGARHWIDESLTMAVGAHRIPLLEISMRVAIAEYRTERARQDAIQALTIGAETGAYLWIPDVIECLAALTTESGQHRDAALLFGSAAGIRERTGAVRFKIYDADHFATVDRLRDLLGQPDFDDQWSRGTALATPEAIDHARVSRIECYRPASGWASLTPAERNVAHLIAEGLRNKDIAAKLVVSTRTVESHLSHIYTKLDLSSRVQLAQEAVRNS
ncbi:transcriptional regulator [Mycolicibacter terrae]|uniref:Transcriptional regulator n=2 Tax=Mycolicibacter terrae TaxID=1788 RepID=A0AAD1HT35_9MYCO|nr:LuxR C-terminal-related transcriptional regulator [Mycolicibacter terrae]BBX20972.1 transcriptional regulator [Mycolicibacter terrae]SNV92693.1 transcriptional regulator [Mycolicibacter terrae]